MIVKLIIHKEMDAISIWNKEGERLYYSDQPKDIKVACDLLMVQKKYTNEFEQRMFGYFNAYWLKKIVQIVKRAEGYSW